MEYVLRHFYLPVSARKVIFPFAGFFVHLHDHFIPHPRNNYHPHIVGHRALALYSALLVAMKIFTLAVLSVGPILPAYSSAITSENIISLTNGSRKDHGLPALSGSSVLSRAAQAKAQDMLEKGYFAHNTPDGRTPWDFIVESGYSYITAGENLAVNFTEAESVEQAWMNSPGHKANILNRYFEEIGIGIAQGEYQGYTAIFVVQMFGTPAEQKVALTDKPTEVQKGVAPEPVLVAAEHEEAVAGSGVLEQKALVPDSIVASAKSQEFALKDPQVVVDGDMVNFTVSATDQAVKVLAEFGGAAVWLEPRGGGFWAGSISLSRLTRENTLVKIKAFDMAGNSASAQVAHFSPSTVVNFQSVVPAAVDRIQFLGRVWSVGQIEQQMYLSIITLLLVALVLTIGIRRHIQHISLIANSSFVIILATLLWVSGYM